MRDAASLVFFIPPYPFLFIPPAPFFHTPRLRRTPLGKGTEGWRGWSLTFWGVGRVGDRGEKKGGASFCEGRPTLMSLRIEAVMLY